MNEESLPGPCRRTGVDSVDDQRGRVTASLRRAGFLAADEEASMLVDHAAGDADRLDRAVARRLTGEPLAWVIGWSWFCGMAIRIAPGVYVPRAHTELLVRRAIERLPPSGVAIEICTGSGAISRVLHAVRPQARIVATDIDPAAVSCARANGVEALVGDLFAPLPDDLRRRTDLVIGVVPYVPRDALDLLQRDTLVFESLRCYDGGADGTRLLRRAIEGAAAHLRPGGSLLLEVGAGQAERVAADLERAGFAPPMLLWDDDGDVRGFETTLRSAASAQTPEVRIDSAQRDRAGVRSRKP